MQTRIEKDTMGEIAVPEDALFGAQTARAIENFPISGRPVSSHIIHALGLIKGAAAGVNRDLGKLSPALAEAIETAADEVARGLLDHHFPVDVFQTGSGTSTNMNANEVIANRAIASLGGTLGSKDPVHPNDHVNMGQSSNDVFPTALHVASLALIEKQLLPALGDFQQALADKAEEFDDIVKIGRTHLQDAVPIRLGQEFSAFGAQVRQGLRHLKKSIDSLRELPIGGTAVGTGLNTHPEFGGLMVNRLTQLVGVEFREAENHFEAQGARDGAVRVSGALKSLAVSLAKMANDVRWLGSGPRLGLGELELPSLQPGSSIMPGKVNPVMAEVMIQVAAQIIGNDAAITTGGLLGQFQLNAMQPLIARNLLEQIELLEKATGAFREKLVLNLRPNRKRIMSRVEQSLAMVTALVPFIGYDKAAEIAKRAEKEEKTIRQVALETGYLGEGELDKILDPRAQTNPG